MIFGDKKFNKEIKALPELSSAEHSLSSQDQARIKQSIMLVIAKHSEDSEPAGFWTRHKIILRYSVLAALILSLLGGTTFASGNAIPGDILYPVKITTEKVQLSLAPTDQSKAQLQAKFAQQRIVELQKLVAQTPPPAPVIISRPTSTPITIITTSTPIITASATPEFRDRSLLEEQAREQASLEVNNALTALKNVQSRLQNRGDSKDAQEINNNISSLQTQADAQNLLNDNSGNRDRGQKQKPQEHTATTTNQTFRRRK